MGFERIWINTNNTNTCKTKKFQTGKIQQVGNSNDIGIMATASGDEPFDGFVLIGPFYFLRDGDANPKVVKRFRFQNHFEGLNYDPECVGSFTKWVNRNSRYPFTVF